LALSFILIAPLLILYEVALVWAPWARGGAGRILRDVFVGLFHTRAGMVVNMLVAGLLVAAVVILARRRRLRPHLIVPMLLESAGWAVALVGLAVLICFRFPAAPLNLAGNGPGRWHSVVSSIGAGVYEEILFRLVITSALYLGGLLIFRREVPWARAFAIVAGGVIFAVCHVVVGASTTVNVFVFHLASGLFFSALYVCRGLGVAVYTHVFYDLISYLGGAGA